MKLDIELQVYSATHAHHLTYIQLVYIMSYCLCKKEPLNKDNYRDSQA